MSGKEPSFSIEELTQGFEAWKAEIYEEFRSDPPPWAIELEANVYDAATTMRGKVEECMEALEALRTWVVGIERLLAVSPVMQDFSLVKEESQRGDATSEMITTTEATSIQPEGPERSKPIRVKVPEPKVYDGVRDAKVIDNFLWQVEQHLKASCVKEEARKVNAATLYLSGDALLWWIRHALEEGAGTSSIQTWKEFKAELRKRFYPANVEHEARKKLRSLKHGGKIREYISQFTSLMLCVSYMSDADKLFSFLDGLKPWAEHEIRRRDVKTLAEALSVAERLTEFEKRSEGQNSDSKEKEKTSEHKATEESEGEKKDNTQQKGKKWGGRDRKGKGPKRTCFICDGDHLMRDCPKRHALNAILKEGSAGQIASMRRYEVAEAQEHAHDRECRRARGSNSRARRATAHSARGMSAHAAGTDARQRCHDNVGGARPQRGSALELMVHGRQGSAGGARPQRGSALELMAHGRQGSAGGARPQCGRALEQTARSRQIGAGAPDHSGSVAIKGVARPRHFGAEAPNQDSEDVFPGVMTCYLGAMVGFKVDINKTGGRVQVNSIASGSNQQEADSSLSRPLVNAVSQPDNPLTQRIREAMQHDPDVLKLTKAVSLGETKRFWMENDLLCTRGGRVYVPRHGGLRKDIMKECHDTLWAGHPGQKRTIALVSEKFYWPGLAMDVEVYVRTCLVCQQDKAERRRPGGLLQPLPIAERPWDSVSMDFILCIKESGGLSAIYVVVDRFSKYATFVALSKKCTASEVAKVFFSNVVKYWGVPSSIISDRDSKFMSRFWTELFGLLGTSLNMSSSFHPQTDGQTERVNQILEDYLRHFVSANQKDWPNLLDIAQFSFNLQKSEATGYSPFEVVLGRQPSLPIEVLPKQSKKSAPAHFMLKRWKETQDLARVYLHKAARRMKKAANQHRRPVAFEVGDQVMLRIRPEQFSMLKARKQGLIRQYEGPFRVLKKVGELAYKLQLPAAWKVHNVFHVSQLKPYHIDPDPNRASTSRGTILTFNQPPGPELDYIITHRSIVAYSGKDTMRQYLVKWKNEPEEDATWCDRPELYRWITGVRNYDRNLTRAST
ncbi:hypothetical protein H6P81_010014 [Aristolochia fimbriata]|uniref:Integrase catalytic domain-containing protein n=1 Tax=Aristolochia fimbriata TaxID=158543 RepID=A0AAV7EN33_ARIFI|nr:hypothetical protein H6P81_010014 [Aristolochia fimbriata]